ncbi:hypothetical protein HMPREF1862_01024 [Varibaculum cambriense]|uniref:Uncharacterized protein n=1 Tax=Varibaculum cambriense TaxID=184870 RepID=A0AB34WZN3_9ACTO|nr:hypothetical protein HMPREF1862_01024 [Varibaculum cambriense]
MLVNYSGGENLSAPSSTLVLSSPCALQTTKKVVLTGNIVPLWGLPVISDRNAASKTP